MIDRAATIEKFGYDPDTLSKGSGKRVVAVCEGCGAIRDLEKKRASVLCRSCAKKKYFKDPKTRKKQSDIRKNYFKNHPEAGEQHSIKMKKHKNGRASRREKVYNSGVSVA